MVNHCASKRRAELPGAEALCALPGSAVPGVPSWIFRVVDEGEWLHHCSTEAGNQNEKSF